VSRNNTCALTGPMQSCPVLWAGAEPPLSHGGQPFPLRDRYEGSGCHDDGEVEVVGNLAGHDVQLDIVIPVKLLQCVCVCVCVCV
jgi:hypothetical protein